jgi:hypothetical protein
MIEKPVKTTPIVAEEWPELPSDLLVGFAFKEGQQAKLAAWWFDVQQQLNNRFKELDERIKKLENP